MEKFSCVSKAAILITSSYRPGTPSKKPFSVCSSMRDENKRLQVQTVYLRDRYYMANFSPDIPVEISSLFAQLPEQISLTRRLQFYEESFCPDCISARAEMLKNHI